MSTDRYDIEASTYDLVYVRQDDIPFYLEYCKQIGGPILELCSGTGRLTVPIARDGYDITGIDLNPKMLKICRAKLAKEKSAVRKRVTLLKGDMRKFSLSKKSNFIFVAFGSFLHNTTIADEESTLGCVASCLADNGLFIVEIFNPGVGRPENVVWLDHMKEIGGGKTMMRMSTYQSDKQNQVSNSTNIYDTVSRNGTIKRKIVQFQLRYIFKDELVNLIERNGLKVDNVYGSVHKEPFNESESKSIVCVARKSRA